MHMKTRTAAAVLALAVLSGMSSGATTPIMPIDEVRPGMIGVGRTVFQGADLADFKVHIIGVLRNVQGPRRDLILARLEGGPLAQTGVAAGMSGSPVYVDGRLIGAVSYSIGAFSKEPIAGITPIQEMKDATSMSRTRIAQQARIELPVTRESLTAALTAAYARLAPFAARPADVQSIGLPATAGAQLGAMMRPISTPLLMAGFEPEVAEMIGGGFRDSGFSPVITGGTSAGTEAPTGPLREGDAIGVSLIGGDLEMGATGTVTHIDGDRVYAFGHPFYNLGPTEFPMTRAYVYTVLPSLASSFKLSTTGEVLGTFLQDRATAIAGRLGPGPRTIPITLTLESPRGAPRTFNFGVVNDQLFTPLMTYAAILNTLGSYERQNGVASYRVRGKAMVKQHDTIT